MRYLLLLSVTLAAADSRLLTLLNQHCGACHSGTQAQGGLSLNSVEALQKGGKHGPARDLIVPHLTGEKTPRMPLGGQLSAEVISEIKAEIAKLPVHSGNADVHWTWLRQAPVTPAMPAVEHKQWARNPIDHFVLAQLEKNKLTPAPEAGRRTLLRRVYFDLVGVPPTPEETRAFLEDKDPQVYEKLIDKLLADSRYGERWGRHWLDKKAKAGYLAFPKQYIPFFKLADVHAVQNSLHFPLAQGSKLGDIANDFLLWPGSRLFVGKEVFS